MPRLPGVELKFHGRGVLVRVNSTAVEVNGCGVELQLHVMSSDAKPEERRRSGRRTGDSGTRAAILAAAREQFASKGYDGASLRVIAAAAGVDTGLIRHFYGSKDELFEVALEIPHEISRRVANALAGGPDGLGERLVDAYLGLWEDPASAGAMLAVVRSAITSDRAADRLRAMFTARFLAEIAPHLQQQDVEVRSALAASHLMGIVIARYVVRVEPIAGLDRATLVAVSAPIVEGFLTGSLLPQARSATSPS